ncbi:MAG: hypothetical protein PHC99_04995 [Methylococcales bacterium]|nr:hypothetical protein [Methylococcales bacterium]
MPQPQVITDHQDLKNELSLYNIPEESLMEIGWRGYAARSNATQNDPPSAAGNYAYFATVRAKRELLCPEGWEQLNKHNLCFTINPETKIAIVASSGNQDVGIAEGHPRTRNSKGERTKDYIFDNYDIFGFEDEYQKKEKPQKDIFPKFETFVFLYFYDFDKGEIRSELSLPIEMDIKGQVSKWHKRIILNPISFDTEPTCSRQSNVSFSDSQDIDIPIKRRQK